MDTLRKSALFALMLVVGATLTLPQAHADDIDIFLGRTGGTANAADVMILIDNSSNWARQSQAWGVDSSGSKLNQGQAEVNAISQAVATLGGGTLPVNIGLAMLTPYNNGASTGGGYIRFGVRDITVGSNATALENILAQIYQQTNGGGQLNEECCGMNHKDETAALYEIYKYFSGLAPYTGQLSQNAWADVNGNLGGGPTGSAGLTAYAQNLTSGFAISNGLYQSPLSSAKPCAAHYVIYIANNSKGNIGSTENVYEPGVVPALKALPATSTDTWTDEWTRFLYQSGAVTPTGNNNGAIATYILDAYDAQNDAGYTTSLQAAARQGGGAYYHVSSAAEVYAALVNILTQIQAVNSTFASASLPINAANRAQDQNQVFIPMFRPDAQDQPRWMGNLKEYQLINLAGNIELGDALGAAAVNLGTGFPTDCAVSFWTTDSTSNTNYPNGYWNFYPELKYTQSACLSGAYGKFTDDPDGPIVEKGGVAEVVRKGNNPPATNTAPTWSPAKRNVLTLSGLTSTTLVPFNTNNTGLPNDLVNWVLGQDVRDENGNGNTTESRPSMHGDAIHSRPLPIDYGTNTSGASGVKVFYGSNDGTLRAVDAVTGQELWAFVAPEFYTPAPTAYSSSGGGVPTGLERLMWSGMADSNGLQISPIINFPTMPPAVIPTPQPKDYYFDGSIGVYQTVHNTSVSIYPTMRRGGRMVYALDVKNPVSPAVLWKAGCPYQTSDTGCTAGMSGIGQTWSIPAVAATILGYTGPVVILGGGYDTCEDANFANPGTVPSATVPASCPSTPKGAGVYVLDAQTGALIKFFPTTSSSSITVKSTRSVVGDVALMSVTTAGVVDHAYAADTGGNIYRIDFAANTSNWVMNRVAYTNDAGRKFLFAPSVLAASGGYVYVAIGSGDREHPLQSQYPYLGVTNRFYVYKDNLASMGGANAVNLDNPDSSVMANFSTDPGCSAPGVLPGSALSGWYMNLAQGEQTVTSAVIAAGMVAFSTNRPVPQTAGTCSNVLGQANGYWVNLFNGSGGIGVANASCGGTRSSQFAGGGLPPSPVLATVPVDGQLVQVIIGAAQRDGGASTAISPQRINPTIVPRRKIVFWKSSGEN